MRERGLIFQGTKNELGKALVEAGHRYPKKRAEYIVSARKWMGGIKEKVKAFNSTASAREWLVDEIKGIGWKEGSHFLRNVGYLNVAILDRHVLKVMSEYNLIGKVGSLRKKKYLECEKTLMKVARELEMSLGELDLYLWYMRTKKILK